ncbi:hypothetical protein TNCV_1887741 [Trichonephila clavipes]|nr:hypothetical protein TNCV_1887741 [Trichonephila clavipes]
MPGSLQSEPHFVNHKYCVACCRKHLSWTDDDREQVTVDTYREYVLIWRKPGSQYRPSNIIEKDHYGPFRWMVDVV